MMQKFFSQSWVRHPIHFLINQILFLNTLAMFWSSDLSSANVWPLCACWYFKNRRVDKKFLIPFLLQIFVSLDDRSFWWLIFLQLFFIYLCHLACRLKPALHKVHRNVNYSHYSSLRLKTAMNLYNPIQFNKVNFMVEFNFLERYYACILLSPACIVYHWLNKIETEKKLFQKLKLYS